MIRIVVVVVLACAVALVGYIYNLHLKKRRDLFFELEKAIDEMKSQIVFSKNFIKDIVNNLSLSKEIRNILDDNIENSPFKKEEIEKIKELFSSIGKSDLDGEKVKLEMAKQKFEEMSKNAEKSYNQNGKLSIKLGMLFGVAIFIFLV